MGHRIQPARRNLHLTLFATAGFQLWRFESSDMQSGGGNYKPVLWEITEKCITDVYIYYIIISVAFYKFRPSIVATKGAWNVQESTLIII
jgi:hypothetical protein